MSFRTNQLWIKDRSSDFILEGAENSFTPILVRNQNPMVFDVFYHGLNYHVKSSINEFFKNIL